MEIDITITNEYGSDEAIYNVNLDDYTDDELGQLVRKTATEMV